MDAVRWLVMLAQAIGGQSLVEGDRSENAKLLYVLTCDRLKCAYRHSTSSLDSASPISSDIEYGTY